MDCSYCLYKHMYDAQQHVINNNIRDTTKASKEAQVKQHNDLNTVNRVVNVNVLCSMLLHGKYAILRIQTDYYSHAHMRADRIL